MVYAWLELDLAEDPDEPRFDGDPAELVDLLDPATLVAALLSPPAWYTHAACRGKGTAVFYPGRGGDLEPARAICADCTVKHDCLTTALALSANLDTGIWGGTSERQRRQLRRTRTDEAAA